LKLFLTHDAAAAAAAADDDDDDDDGELCLYHTNANRRD